MHEHGRRSPARLLAPLALILFTLAVVVVVAGSSVDGDDGGSDDAGNRSSSTTTSPTNTTPQRRRSTYIVKTGDTLGAIAEKTGVSVERLQELNPNLDPQALLSGQKISLRE